MVTYDVLVNETLVTSYSYSKNVTRVFNIHSTDKTHGLGAEGLAWVMGTASPAPALSDARARRVPARLCLIFDISTRHRDIRWAYWNAVARQPIIKTRDIE